MAHRPTEYPTLETEVENPNSGFTLRAVFISLVFIALLCACSIHSRWILKSTIMAADYLPSGFLMPFFFVVAVLSPLLKLLRKRWGLTEKELAVIAIMGLCACIVPQRGIIVYFFATTSAPYYYASPENLWAENFHAYLPTWLVPSDRQAITWFFEGKPSPNAAIPWSVWLLPLFWWMSLFSAFTGACLCLLVILRKQWMENERMPYPLAEIPLTMIKRSGDKRLTPLFMRDRVFWLGFGFMSSILLWNFISYWFPMLTRISWRLPAVRFGPDFPIIRLVASPLVISIAFLLRLDVSFSIWFFHLLVNLQIGLFSKLGIPLGGDPIGYDARPPGAAWQGFGGFVVLVLSGIWIARHHLMQVLRKALGLDARIDDSRELFSFRAACIGFLVLSAYCIVFFWRSGMSPAIAALFVFLALFSLLGLTRIIIDAGLVFIQLPLSPQTFITDMVGTKALAPHTLTSLGLSYTFLNVPGANFMPFAAHSLRIGHNAHLKPRSVLAAMVVSIVFASAICIPMIMALTYNHGAYNFRSWLFTGHPHRVYTYIVRTMNNPRGTNILKLKYAVCGTLFTGLLMFLRYRYSWFPINPIGFPLAMVYEIKWTAVSIFIGWFVKVMIVKLGGARMYEKAKPFFIGVLLAFVTGAVLSYIIDALFLPGGVSHPIHMYW